MSFEPEEISLKPDKSLTRADVEALLLQQGSPARLNLSGLNLSVVDFSGMDLSGAAFSYTHLNGANLLNANLEKADLRGARLNGVRGSNTRLAEANLDGASLIEARLEGAVFWKAQLTNANLSGAALRNADLHEVNLTGANLSEADLSGADLSKACLYQANLSRTILLEANLTEADLHEAILGGAKLHGARLEKTNLSRVRLVLVKLQEAKLCQANLSHCDLSWSDLSRANLSRADLSEAKLVETDLTGADLRDAILTNANFSGANLTEARLIGADLQAVNLSGANLTGAYLSEQQKALLDLRGDVLGLAETRTAQELSDLEAQHAPEEVPESPNGFVTPIALVDLEQPAPDATALEAAAELPLLVPETFEDTAATAAALPDLPSLVVALDSQSQGPDATAETPVPDEAAAPGLKLLIKEQPLGAQSLANLLAALEELYGCFRLIEQGRFAELIEFSRITAKRGEQPAALIITGFSSASGEIELASAENPSTSLQGLDGILAGIVRPEKPQGADPAGRQKAVEAARVLAETTLQSLFPGLDPAVRVMAAQTMLESILSLATGPELAPGGNPPGDFAPTPLPAG